MKICNVVLLTFVGQLNVLGQQTFSDDKQSDNKDQGKIYDGNNKEYLKSYENNQGKSNNAKYFNTDKSIRNNKQDGDDDYDDPGNPDNRAIIVRPCPFFDIFCIRKFFAEHSKCKIVPGPIIEPFYSAENQLYLANNNISVTLRDTLLGGLNGRIDEFYVNKVTGNLVLSVYFEGIKVATSRVYLRFNKNGEEPVETVANAAIDYLKTTVTIVIPNFNNLRLEDAELNGYLDDPFPPFVIGPSAFESTDPTVAVEVASLLADIPTAAIENLVTVGPLVGKIFVEKNICDFGVPINRI